MPQVRKKNCAHVDPCCLAAMQRSPHHTIFPFDEFRGGGVWEMAQERTWNVVHPFVVIHRHSLELYIFNVSNRPNAKASNRYNEEERANCAGNKIKPTRRNKFFN